MLKQLYQADRLQKTKTISALVALNFAQLGVCVVLTLFLLSNSRNERILIVPPGISTENAVKSGIWVEGDDIGAGYIEKFGSYLSSLLLNYQPSRAKFQFERALYEMDPTLAIKLKPKLMADVQRIKQYSISSVYQTSDHWVDKNKFITTGQLSIFYGDKLVSRGFKTFAFEFETVAGRVVIKRYDEVKGSRRKGTKVVDRKSDDIPTVNEEKEDDEISKTEEVNENENDGATEEAKDE